MQNIVATGEYARQINLEGLAVARGVSLTRDDRVRRYTIERLMCEFAVSFDELKARFGFSADTLIAELRSYAASDRDELLVLTATGVVVTGRGRPFVRSVAAAFDAYLAEGKARHSIAV